MPTQAQITAAATTLSAVARANLLSLIRVSSRYREQNGQFPNLETVVDAASAVQNQQLNAALSLIDSIGDGTVALTGGGEDSVDYSQERDRAQLVDYMISVLYDSPVVRAGIGVASMTRVRSSACCSRCGYLTYNCHCY